MEGLGETDVYQCALKVLQWVNSCCEPVQTNFSRLPGPEVPPVLRPDSVSLPRHGARAVVRRTVSTSSSFLSLSCSPLSSVMGTIEPTSCGHCDGLVLGYSV